MANVQLSPYSPAVLLHQSTTGGITWRVLLRPELRRAGESEVVEFVKLGRKGKLLDQVIGWSGGSWRSEPSRKVPQWLRTEIVGLLRARQPAGCRSGRQLRRAPQGGGFQGDGLSQLPVGRAAGGPLPEVLRAVQQRSWRCGGLISS
jgi:hypothetical protein